MFAECCVTLLLAEYGVRSVSIHAPRECIFVTVRAVKDAGGSVTLLLAEHGVRSVAIHAPRGVLLLSARPTMGAVYQFTGEKAANSYPELVTSSDDGVLSKCVENAQIAYLSRLP